MKQYTTLLLFHSPTSGCWDNGVLHPRGDVWPSDEPCHNNVCTGLGITLRPVDCPDFPKPHESCFEVTPEGECCPTWNCRCV